MTNYELLVKEGKLEDFINEIIGQDLNSMMLDSKNEGIVAEEGTQIIGRRYKIPVLFGQKISDAIADWLREEHPRVMNGHVIFVADARGVIDRTPFPYPFDLPADIKEAVDEWKRTLHQRLMSLPSTFTSIQNWRDVLND